jgi:formylglycine-generating enzyme required for sulfatase activity
VVQAGQHFYTAKPAQEPSKQDKSTTSTLLFATIPTHTTELINAIRKMPKSMYPTLLIMIILFFSTILRSFTGSSPHPKFEPRYGTPPPPPVKVQPSVSVDKLPHEIFTEIETNMVRIPSGTFTMGTEGEVGDEDETPQHRVTISSFYLSNREVTQQQWREVAFLPKVKTDLPPHPSRFHGDLLPVESISWDEAIEFCERLSRKTGRKYRLPTEAEWECASRAGQIEPNFANTEMMWYEGNSNGSTHIVAQKKSNSIGLYDMYGNVREWCSDWYDKNYYTMSPKSNPAGAKVGKERVIRGGGYDAEYAKCRPAFRDKDKPSGVWVDLGMRLAMSLNQNDETAIKQQKKDNETSSTPKR